MSIITDQEAEIKKLKKKLKIYQQESCGCGDPVLREVFGYSPSIEKWKIEFTCDGGANYVVTVNAAILSIEEMAAAFNHSRLLRKFGSFAVNTANEISDELIFYPSPLFTTSCGGTIAIFNISVV